MRLIIGKLLSRGSILSTKNANRGIATRSPLNAFFAKDWQPSKPPRTEAERKAAAEKYNLHEKEYKYYNEDEHSYGDYPELPYKGVALRDIHYPYDIPEHRRNFNEPVPIDIDMIGEDRFTAGNREYYSGKFMLASFFLIFGSLYAICYLSHDFIAFPPVTEKQYPWKQKKYYTFEKAD